MAVAFDASAESHTGTTGSVSEASFSFSLTLSASARGCLVFTVSLGTTDIATSVTVGGVALTAVTGGRAVSATASLEIARRGILARVSPRVHKQSFVNRTNDATVMYAVAVSVTAGRDTEVAPSPVLIQGISALAEQNVDDGSTSGTDSVRFAGLYSGLDTTPANGANTSSMQFIDSGATVCRAVRDHRWAREQASWLFNRINGRHRRGSSRRSGGR